jgi:hypothetical protein
MSEFNKSGGVGVMGFLSPLDTRDTYAVIDPIYGIDGLRNVSTIEELHAIPTERRRAGMIVGVYGGEIYYKLKNLNSWTFDLTDWEEFFGFSNNSNINTEIRFSDHESPTGIIDGHNKIFNLTNEPLENTQHLYLNGLLQSIGDDFDYNLSGDTIIFNQPPKIGSKVNCSYRYQLVIDNLNQAKFSDSEKPIGVIDGDNTFFILENEPKNNSEHLYLNGLLMSVGGDYTINGNQITFHYPPPNGSRLLCTYRF